MDPLSSSSSIPVMRSPNDLMANGPNSDNLAAAAIQTHPVDRMQRGELLYDQCKYRTSTRAEDQANKCNPENPNFLLSKSQ